MPQVRYYYISLFSNAKLRKQSQRLTHVLIENSRFLVQSWYFICRLFDYMYFKYIYICKSWIARSGLRSLKRDMHKTKSWIGNSDLGLLDY